MKPADPFIEIDTRCHKCGRVAGYGARDSRVFALDIEEESGTVRLYYCSECASARPVTEEWRHIMYHAMIPKRR